MQSIPHVGVRDLYPRYGLWIIMVSLVLLQPQKTQWSQFRVDSVKYFQGRGVFDELASETRV